MNFHGKQRWEGCFPVPTGESPDFQVLHGRSLPSFLASSATKQFQPTLDDSGQKSAVPLRSLPDPCWWGALGSGILGILPIHFCATFKLMIPERGLPFSGDDAEALRRPAGQAHAAVCQTQHFRRQTSSLCFPMSYFRTLQGDIGPKN